MKKAIISIVFLIFISLGFVLATMTFVRDRGDTNSYLTEVSLEKGWNLVAFGDFESGDIKTIDLVVVYIYNPFTGKYLQVYPETNEAEREYDKLEEKYDSYFSPENFF